MTTEFSIDDISTEVRRNWNVLQNVDYNPIPVALELLQKNNPTRDPQSFTAIHDRLEAAMESIINQNYTAFNDSVAMFGSIVDDIQATRQVISKLKADVESFRDQLEYRRSDIQGTMEKLAALRLDSKDKKEQKKMVENVKRVKELLDEDELEPAVKFYKSNNIGEAALRTLIIERLYALLLQVLFAEEIDQMKLALVLALLVEMDAPFDDNFKTGSSIRTFGMDLVARNPLKPVSAPVLCEALLDIHLKRYLKAELLSFGPSLKNICALLVSAFSTILKAVEGVPALHERLKADFETELAHFAELCVKGKRKRGEFTLQMPNPVVMMTAILKNEPVKISPSYQYQPFYDQEIQNELNQTLTLNEIDLKKLLEEEEEEDADYPLNLKANPQYLVFVYQTILQFSNGGGLERQLEELCLSEYYSVLENWIVEEIKANISTANDAFFRKKRDTPANIFLNFTQMLKKLMLVKQAVPMAPVDKLLLRLFDSLSMKLDEQVKDICYSGIDSKRIHAISSAMSQSKTLRELYALHPALKHQSSGLEATLAEKEIIYMEQLKQDRSLHKGEVIFDNKKLELLAIIQEGCEFITKCLDGEEESFELEFFQPREDLLKCALSVKQPIEFVEFHDEALISKFMNLRNGLEELGKTLLYMLRIELRVHCIYYLDLAYREGNYDGNSDAADSYIELLTADIIRIRSLLERCLVYEKFLFVMDGLSASLNELCIASLHFVKRFAWPVGPRKLDNNVELLEQCLALVSLTNNSGSLDRARTYYELSKLSISDLLDGHLKEELFSMIQCVTLVKLHYLGSENDPARYKEMQNQLVRLKYLFEPSSAE